jgi:hypothetical protein
MTYRVNGVLLGGGWAVVVAVAGLLASCGAVAAAGVRTRSIRRTSGSSRWQELELDEDGCEITKAE